MIGTDNKGGPSGGDGREVETAPTQPGARINAHRAGPLTSEGPLGEGPSDA